MSNHTATDSPLHVVVLAGGISHERDVSLRSGRRLADALHRAGHRVDVVDPDANLMATLHDSRPDVVWPTLHGTSGEDGALYSLLRASGFAYVGSRPTAARFAWNKGTAKGLAKRAGLRTPESIVLPGSIFRELGASSVIDAIADGLTLPAVVKPVEGGSAQGVSFVDTIDEFPAAFVTALTYVDTVLIERKITGTEVMVGILDRGDGPETVTPVEVVPKSGVFDYGARYNAGETTYFAPARLDAEVIERCTEVALRAYREIGMRDIARVDLIVDDEGTPWFIEADPIPGLTETSILPLAIESTKQSLAAVYSEIAHAVARRGPDSTADVDEAATVLEVAGAQDGEPGGNDAE